MKKTKYRLKPQVKRFFKTSLLILFVSLTIISIYQLITVKKVKKTPVGSYECRGGIIKLCSGSNEVKNYLGD